MELRPCLSPVMAVVGLLIIVSTASADLAVDDGPKEVDDTPTPPLSAPAVVTAVIQQQQAVVRTRVARAIVTRRIRETRRQGRRFRTTQRRQRRTAGDFFEHLELATDYSFASYSQGSRDSTGADDGNGHDSETTTALTGMIGDSYQVGLSYSRASLDRGGVNPFNQHNDSGEVSMNYLINDAFAVGGFVAFQQTDIEDVEVDDSWGAGLLASYSTTVGEFDVGVTTSLSSLEDNDSVGDVFDDADAILAAMIDIQRAMSESVSAAMYSIFLTKLDNDTPDGRVYNDQTYWVVGADLSYAPNDAVAFSIGYETTLELDRYQDNRLNASIVISW